MYVFDFLRSFFRGKVFEKSSISLLDGVPGHNGPLGTHWGPHGPHMGPMLDPCCSNMGPMLDPCWSNMGPCWTMLVQDGGRTMRIRGGLDEVYVGYVESWKIPIGEDDTQESRI